MFSIFALGMVCRDPAHAAIGNHRSYSCAAAIELALADGQLIKAMKGRQVLSNSQYTSNALIAFFTQSLGLRKDGPQILTAPVSIDSSENPSMEVVEAPRAKARAVTELVSGNDESVNRSAIGITDPNAIATLLSSWTSASRAYNELHRPSIDATFDSVKLILTMFAALPAAGIGIVSGNPYLIGPAMFLAARVSRSTTKGMDFRNIKRIEKLQGILNHSQPGWGYFG